MYLLNESGNWDDCGAGTLSLAKEISDINDKSEDYFKVIAMDNFIPSIEENKLKKINNNNKSEQNIILYLKIIVKNDYEK